MVAAVWLPAEAGADDADVGLTASDASAPRLPAAEKKFAAAEDSAFGTCGVTTAEGSMPGILILRCAVVGAGSLSDTAASGSGAVTTAGVSYAGGTEGAAGGITGSAGAADETTGATGAPQAVQKALPLSTGAPQFVQNMESLPSYTHT